MTDNQIYNELLKYQGLSFGSLDIEALINAAVEAGRHDDNNNFPVKILDTEDRRAEPIITVDYFLDDEGKENISIATDSFNRDFQVDGIDINRIKNLLNKTFQEFGDTEIYIDTQYGYEQELDENNKTEPDENDKTESNEDEKTKSDENEKDDSKTQDTKEEKTNEEQPIVIDNRRTVIDSEERIQLNDVAKRLRSLGYDVRTIEDSALEVTHPDLSKGNTITITKRNAYIENATLSTKEAKKIFDDMKKNVERQMNKSLRRESKKTEIIKSSASIGGLSSVVIAEKMVKDVIMEGKTLTFKDEKGNDFITIKGDKSQGLFKTVEMSLGEGYSGYKTKLYISPQFVESLKNGNICLTGTYSEINEFIQKELDNIKEARMLLGDKHIDKYTYAVEKDGEVLFDSSIPKPREYNYDREWMNTLAKMEDKLTDLRNGPIQNSIDMSKSIMKGTKEIISGIVKIEKDGILTGPRFLNGFKDFREGLNFSKDMKVLTNEYLETLKLNPEAAARQKAFLNVSLENMNKTANVYFKSAVAIRNKIDQMINSIHSARTYAYNTYIDSKFKHTMDAKFDQLKESISNGSKFISQEFKKMKNSGIELGNDFIQLAGNFKNYSIESAKNARNALVSNINDIKNQYNESMINKAAILSMEQYTNEKMAEKINDFYVESSINSVSTLSTDIQKPLWNEIPALVQRAKIALNEPEELRTDSEKALIERAKQARESKEQYLFCAEKVNEKLVSMISDKSITPEKAVNELTNTFIKAHQSYFSNRNGYTPINVKIDSASREKFNEMFKEAIPKDVMAKFENNKERIEQEHGNGEKGDGDKGDGPRGDNSGDPR